MESAHKTKKTNILITNTGSYLGSQLAKSLLNINCTVFGVDSAHVPQDVLKNRDFTLLEIDLSQPLPAYLPDFDIVFDLSLLGAKYQSAQQIPHVSLQTQNALALAKKYGAKIIIFAPITTQVEFYEYLVKGDSQLKEKVSLFLVGDLYGPNMPLHEENELGDLIKQAIKTDKIILKNEGLDHIYPSYITDITFGINKLVFSNHPKKVHFLISEGAKTSLSVAYEIQNTIRLISGKELGLFFSGPAGTPRNAAELVLKMGDMGFSPKIDLKEGLKDTLKFFEADSQIESNPKSHHIGNLEKPHPAFTNERQYNPQNSAHLPKIPTFSPSLKPKTLILAFFALLILTLSKTALDIYLGTQNLKGAKQSLTQADFQKAKSRAQNSNSAFKAAANKTKILTLPFSFVFKNQTNSLNYSLQAAQSAALSTAYFVEASETLAHDFAQIADPSSKNEGFDLETPSANFRKAYQKSQEAMHLLESAKYIPLKSQIENAKSQIKTLNTLSQRAYELSSLTQQFVGQGDPKTYLVLLENNTELRPGGGFIGNFATIEFEQGKLKSIEVEDIYTIDGQLKEKIEPPPQLKEKLGVENFYLRDSNWAGDFEVNSKTARDFFKKETGKDVDGVITLDLTLVQNILSKMGPIFLADYNEEITAENLFERGEYYSEVGFFPGSTQKRDFFGALTRTMVAKIVESTKKLQDTSQNESTSLPWLALIEASGEGLPQKHLMLTFDDPTLASFVKTKGWNHPLPPSAYNPSDDAMGTRDYLALVEANLSANKVNRFLERKVSYEMTIGKEADLVANLKITYTNNSQAETWPAGKYVNYLRVYVPQGAGLEDFELSIPPEVEPSPSPQPRRTQQPSSPQQDGIVDKNDVEVTTQGSLTVFSTYVEVPIKSTQVVTFKYRIPKNIKLETAPTYSVYFQKQAGTEKDPLDFTFNLPAYLQIQDINGDETQSTQQNITFSTDLSTDRQFTINLAKK